MAERTSPADQERGRGQPEQKLGSPDDPNTAAGDFTGDGQKDSTEAVEDAECPGCQSLGVLTLPCGHKLCATCFELGRGELGRGELGQGELSQAGCTICYGSQLMDSVLHTLLDALFQGQPRRHRGPPGAEEERVLGMVNDGNAGDGYDSLETEDVCVQHGGALSGFCLEDEELLCPECRTEQHDQHQCSSIQEAVLICKRQLRSAVRRLQEKLENMSSIRQTWEETAAHITSQSVTTAQILREEFEKMHQYLRDEEAELMSQLKQEEEEKSQKMENKITRISNDIRVLTTTIREAEEAMAPDSVLFLKDYKKASERTRCRVEEPEDESGALLDVAKHQGCFQHRVWENMMKLIQYFPVTLDPNTGSTRLSVSPDLSSVLVCEEQPLPDNPERFVRLQSILGSEGFSSGRHSWEVEVGDNGDWSLGVASETVRRKDRSSTASDSDPAGGLWTVSLSSGEYCASPGHTLTLRRRPRRVRVQLDWERGCLTFSDANDNTLIYRFKRQWSGTLRPYFSTTCSKHPLKITPGRVNVAVE
ncbi:E3 ubiquitin-protein ligase TRIM35 [Aulostomus maculatus]